jgi:GNAT superfamily N-acetyltransferase
VHEFVIRPALPSDAAAIAQVRVDAWRTTYRGMIPDAYLAAMKVEESTALWEKVLAAAPNTTNTFVAERDGTVLGFAAGHMLAEPKHGMDAELSAVYLVREAQRAGIGRRLVAAVAAAQRAHGATGLIAWVIAGNKPARAFYEALGAQLLIEQPFTWDGMDLVETGYGWHDLTNLISAAGDVPAMFH